MVKPWRTLASRTVLRDRWIDVRADDCVTAGGHMIAPYYVLTYPDFVNVVALTPANELVMVELYRHAAAQVLLELPGGMMDAGETDPVQSALRELREETGYVAGQAKLVTSLFTNPATHTNRVHTVLATGCQAAGKPALEAGEDGMTVRLMPVETVLGGLADGLLGQSMHVAGLLLALAAVPADGEH